MPFVLCVGRAITDGDRDRVELVEQACKAAWVAMNGVFPESGPCREGDVGGVVGFVPTGPSPIEGAILFAYIFRSERFEVALEKHLHASLESLYRERGLVVPKVQMIRTSPLCWFADPVWAQAPRKQERDRFHDYQDLYDPDYYADCAF